MRDDYSWKEASARGSTYHAPKDKGLGLWVLVALLFAVIFHLMIIWGFSRMDVVFSEGKDSSVTQTEVVRVQREVQTDTPPEVSRPEVITEPTPVEVLPPVTELDELDMLESIVDVEIDIRPDVKDIEVPLVKSALSGALDGESFEPMKAAVFDPDLPEMGFTEELFARSRDTQLVIDPGSRMAEEFDPDEYTDSLRKGAGGSAADGLFEGFSSLSDMVQMDGNSLLASKALIGSDLLFDFNSSTLRQSARVSLMKVALLIDKNPNLICWVDGHSDLIGGEERNLVLSQKRAMSVKNWLVKTLDLNASRVAVSGYGKTKPLILSGTADEQASNRRVEIKMRKGRPKNETHEIKELPRIDVASKASVRKDAKVEVATELLEAPDKPVPVAIVIDETEPVLVKPQIPKPSALEVLSGFEDPEKLPEGGGVPLAEYVPDDLPSLAEAGTVEEPPLRAQPVFEPLPEIHLTDDVPLAIEDLEDQLLDIHEPPVAIPVDE